MKTLLFVTQIIFIFKTFADPCTLNLTRPLSFAQFAEHHEMIIKNVFNFNSTVSVEGKVNIISIDRWYEIKKYFPHLTEFSEKITDKREGVLDLKTVFDLQKNSVILLAPRRNPLVLLLNEFHTPNVITPPFLKISLRDFNDAYLDSLKDVDQPVIVTIGNEEKIVVRRISSDEDVPDVTTISSVDHNTHNLMIRMIKQNEKFLVQRGEARFSIRSILFVSEIPIQRFGFGVSAEDIRVHWKSVLKRLAYGQDSLLLTHRDKPVGKIKLESFSNIDPSFEEVTYDFLKNNSKSILLEGKQSVFVKISDEQAVVITPLK